MDKWKRLETILMFAKEMDVSTDKAAELLDEIILKAKEGRQHMFELTLQEADFLMRQGFRPNRFLSLTRDWESFTFIEIRTGKKLVLRR